ncbi:hypothetical protein LP414_27320 [Polaromonas sp. P1(28)-13]|nr:hypothetical protein LP414_27320 [Polaromonas sp. P1(28)-13]
MKKTLIVLAVALALSACGRSNDIAPQPVAQQYSQQGAAPAPVIVNQAPAAPQNDGMFSGALMGGLAGYMLGRNTGGSGGVQQSAAPAPTVVHKTVNNYHPAPVAVPAKAAAVPTPPPAAPKPSYATSYSAAKPAAPSRLSYSSSSSRSGKR